MTRDRILGITAAGLLVILGIQIGPGYRTRPAPRAFASWRDRPTSVKAAKALADTVVLGRVTNIRAAAPLVVTAPAEPGAVDQVPVEAVTVQVERFYKGGGAGSLEIFRTGATVLAAPSPETDPLVHQLSLEDDPSYVIYDPTRNEKKVKYLLFLRPGPQLTVGGTHVATRAVVAPEGRYMVDASNKLKPAVPQDRGGFANQQFRDKDLATLEAEINQSP
jgi:hypothetical protein